MKFTRFSFLLLCFVASSFAGAAQNYYLKVMDGNQINGDSQAAGYLNWTEINAFNAGSTLPNVSFTQGTGRPDSKCFTISMFQDKMAYYLKRKLFLGSTLTSIQLDFTRTNGSTVFVYYRVQMENVFVTAIEEAQTQGNSLITMNVSFLPARFRYTYFTQNPLNGNTAATTTFGWDVTTNTIW